MSQELHVLFAVIDDPELIGSTESVNIIGYTDHGGYERAAELAAKVAKVYEVYVAVAPAFRLGDPAVAKATDEAALMIDDTPHV